MKLHLPVLLRKALLACFAFNFACSASAHAADLTLGGKDSLTIDYAVADPIHDLEGGTLTLNGDAILQLFNCGKGDGKIYTLATGISSLLDAEGNAITLDSTNNAISKYFDVTHPGTGFWAGSALVLTADGSLQLVRHNETVTAAETITTRQTGGAAYQYYAGVSFENIEYSSSLNAYGGAVYGGEDGVVTLSGNGSVTFMGNTVSSTITSLPPSYSFSFDAFARGGAIYGDWNSTISLSGNGSVTFMGNTVSTTFTTITSTTSYPITAFAYGGAICGPYGSDLTLNNNGRVVFEGNTASSSCSSFAEGWTIGGAIYGDHSTITLSNNGSVIFSKNSVTSTAADGHAYGGAIYDYFGCITLSNNGNVTFIGNTACSCVNSDFTVSGGAIACYMIEVNYNNSVTFSGNTATVVDAFSTSVGDADAGAIRGTYISFSNNGTVSFSGNKVEYMAYGTSEYRGGDTIGVENFGGAITASSTDSDSKALGGAIYVSLNLDIHNNNSVLFEKNAEVTNGEYRLRSIYVAGGNDGKVSLSAAAGKSITFRDSIYIGYDSTVSLNANYTDAEGNVHKQQGDIIFTGATTEDDLYSVKGNVAGTEKEIRLSRTSEVLSTANLYNGRLIIKEGAIWSGAGITVDPVAGATGKPTLLLQNGTLTHDASSVTNRNVVTIKSGGAFEVAGKSQADYTSLNMESGSILTFNIAPENASTAALTLDSNSSLTQEGALTLKLKGDNRLVKGQSYKLLTGLAQPDTWDETSVTVESGSLGWDVDYTDLTWEGDTLWLYYNGNILPPVEFRPNLDRNQQTVYDTIKDIMGESNPGGVLGELGKNILDSRDESALKRALDELSGREYATIMSSQMEGNLGHLRRLRSAAGKGTPLGEFVTMPAATSLSNKGVDKSGKGATVMMAPSPVVDSRRIRAGIAVFHEQGELDADRNGDGFERSETGAQLTMEYLVSNEFIMGMGISQSRTRLTPDYGKRQDEDNTHFDLYGVYQSGSWSSTTSLGVGLHQHELGRTVAGMQTEAEADGFSVNFLQELAYAAWADEEQGVQVFAAVESSFNKVDGFTEKGAGNASLQIENQDAWVTDVTLGLRYNRALPALSKAAPGTLSLQGGVVASLGDVEQSATMSFTGAPGYRFKQHGAERERWGYSVGASVNLPVSADVAVYGTAEAVMRNDAYTVDAQLGLKMAF